MRSTQSIEASRRDAPNLSNRLGPVSFNMPVVALLYGADDWVMQTVSQLGLQHTVRPEGRPRKANQVADELTNWCHVGARNAKRKRTESRPGHGCPDR
ncbi:MAG: hypothetical protein ACLQIB_10560 [Isosphaeraceae bacterium]